MLFPAIFVPPVLRAFPRVAAVVLLATAGAAQEPPPNVMQVSPHLGEMFATMPAPGEAQPAEAAPSRDAASLRFEPWELIDEMFLRDDVVWVMRHGPTDWSKLDVKGVEPTDCANQRVMSPEGRADMVDLGAILADNDVLPGRIIVSQWCRNQQTAEALLEGAALIDPAYPTRVPVQTDSDLNLLLALGGAPSVAGLRETVSSWDGGDGEGPLLIVTHFTNIEEMLDFSVYEGEILVVDPKRGNRVLGYLRLRSSAPDVGHFSVE